MEAVVDTSDLAVAVLLDLAHEKGARRIELGLMSSGQTIPAPLPPSGGHSLVV